MNREERHNHSEAESRSPQAHAAKGPKDRSEDQISQRKAWTLKEFSGKTVWDWLQLLSALAIPVVLAVAGLYLESQLDARQRQFEKNRAQKAQEIENQRAEAERELAEQRGQDEALQAYLNQMSSLLLEKDLRDSDKDSEVRTLARARTLTALRRLDPGRKGELIQFLVEADLVQSVEGRAPLITLRNANLSETNVSEANLSGADLSEANLTDADLSHANLSETNLSEANVSEANLAGADLSEADVSDADLSEAELNHAILSETTLSGVSGLSEKRLKQEANTITGASLPNEIFSDDFSDTSGGWVRGEYYKNTDRAYGAGYVQGRYRMYSPPPGSSAYSYSTEYGNQEDIIVEVDAQVSGDAPHGTDKWGVICRFQDRDNFYVFGIGPEGYADIQKLENNKWKLLEYVRKSEYIHPRKEENHLRADCLGNKLTLFVNGHEVIEAKDSTFDSGSAGLYIQDHGDHKFEVLFDNFLVSKP